MRDTYRVGPRVTVLVVADIDVPMAHGFVPRYEVLIASLRRRAEVTVVGISPKIETVLPFTEMPLIAPMAFDEPRTSSMGRLGNAVHLLGGRLTQSAWERELVGGLRFTEPDVIVTLNYRRRELTRLAARVAPTVLFAEERNATGLIDIIDALGAAGWPEGLRLRLVSATGFHPGLSERAGPAVVLEGTVADPRAICAGAMAMLVPAFRAFGVKTGILQGWAMGRCVVTTAPSAETVGGTHAFDLLAGSTPDQVADLIRGLPAREDRAGIVMAGRDHLALKFSAEAHDAAVDDLLDAMGR